MNLIEFKNLPDTSTPINAENLNKTQQQLVDTIYPVGSVYISINATDPKNLFGGTWERIKDTFLLSAGDTYSAGSTGGEAKHTLTEAEMPRHMHPLIASDGSYSSAGSGYYHMQPSFEGWSGGTVRTIYYNSSRADYVGEGQEHNNMPPYLTVYMWKRTA